MADGMPCRHVGCAGNIFAKQMHADEICSRARRKFSCHNSVLRVLSYAVPVHKKCEIEIAVKARLKRIGGVFFFLFLILFALFLLSFRQLLEENWIVFCRLALCSVLYSNTRVQTVFHRCSSSTRAPALFIMSKRKTSSAWKGWWVFENRINYIEKRKSECEMHKNGNIFFFDFFLFSLHFYFLNSW